MKKNHPISVHIHTRPACGFLQNQHNHQNTQSHWMPLNAQRSSLFCNKSVCSKLYAEKNVNCKITLITFAIHNTHNVQDINVKSKLCHTLPGHRHIWLSPSVKPFSPWASIPLSAVPDLRSPSHLHGITTRAGNGSPGHRPMGHFWMGHSLTDQCKFTYNLFMPVWTHYIYIYDHEWVEKVRRFQI